MDAREYLREMVLEHRDRSDYRTRFACVFPSERPETVNLLEVSPKVLDSGDAYFDAVSLALPTSVSGARHVQIILVTPRQFEQALTDPSTPGGQLIERLRLKREFEILLGARTSYARALTNPGHAAREPLHLGRANA
jgi:hypothetical protein